MKDILQSKVVLYISYIGCCLFLKETDGSAQDNT